MARSIVSVYQRPRVAILATGDELVDLDEICELKIIKAILMQWARRFRSAVRCQSCLALQGQAG